MAARSRRFVPAKDGGFTTSSVAEVPVKFVLTEHSEDELAAMKRPQLAVGEHCRPVYPRPPRLGACR